MSRGRRIVRALGVVGVLLIPPALLMPKALFGGRVLSPADALFEGYAPWNASAPADFAGAAAPQALEAALRFDPGLEFTDDWLKRGRIPFWNPWNGFGEPFLGHARAAAFHPLEFLRLVFPTGKGRAFRTAFLLFLAGWFTYRLLLALGVSRSAALFGAVAYAMNGFHLARIHFPDVRVAVLLPLLVWAMERLLRRPEGLTAAGLGLAVGLVFLGDHPETGLPLILGALGYAILRSATGARSLGGPRRLGRAGIWLAIALMLGLALGWAQIALTAADGAWPVATTDHAASAESLLGLFAPGLFGPPRGGWWGATPPVEGIPYFSVIALLAGVVAVATGARTDGRVRALALLAVGGAALAVGFPAPLVSTLRALPGLEGLACGPFTAVLALAGTALAALGVQRCLEPGTDRPVSGWTLAGSSALVSVGLLAALWRFGIHHPDQPIAQLWQDGALSRVSARLALAAGLAALGVALLDRLRGARAPRACLTGLVALVLLDLWVHGHEHVSEIERRPDRDPVEALDAIPEGARFAAVGPVLPPWINLGLNRRDVRGQRSRDLPRMTALLDHFLPSDPETGLTGVGPGATLVRFGVSAWFSARPFGPRGVRLVVEGPPRSTGLFQLRTGRPVSRLTLHTSLENAWTLEEGRAVAEVVVVGREREVSLTLRAGQDTGDAALEEYRAFARHALPTPSGTWSIPGEEGVPRTRHCYPRTLELDPPLTPERLRITWLGGPGRFRLHQVEVDAEANPPDSGFDVTARIGRETRISGLHCWRANDPVLTAFLSSTYRVVGDSGEATAADLVRTVSTGSAAARRPALRFEPVRWIGPDKTVPPPPGRIAVARRDSHPGRFAVDLPPRAWSTVLVIREAYHPGWSAVSNRGAPVPTEPVDFAFLGAVLPPGPAETVTFTFVPPGLVSGLWISGLAAVALLVLAAVGLAARRRATAAATRPAALDPSEGRVIEPAPEEPETGTPEASSDADQPNEFEGGR